MITPNGDGANDVLTFRGLEYYPDNTLTIFNRWGNIILKLTDIKVRVRCYLMEPKREAASADTYYYILQFDNKVYKNPLTILRINSFGKTYSYYDKIFIDRYFLLGLVGII